MQKAIAARVKRRETITDFNAAERDKMLARIAIANEVGDPRVSKSCVTELNKCSGRHSIKVNLDVTETIVDIVARSREIRR